MKHTTSLLTAGFVYGALAQREVPPNFEIGAKFQIVIQHTLDFNAPLAPTDAVVWDLDLYHVARHPEIVEHLRASNPDVILMCYFNAGLAQTSDCDYESRWNNSGFLGNSWGDEFPDEFWINIKEQEARDLVKERITLARDKGCDAVDPDNIDGWWNDADGENGTGWNLSEADYVNFVTELAEHAHGLTTLQGYTMLIGQKNAPDIVDQVHENLDFAVLEDCKTLNDDEDGDWTFCQQFQTYIADGKPVFSIEYPSTLGDTGTGACTPGGVSPEQFEASCDDTAGNSGFSTVLKIQGDVGELNGCTQYCAEQIDDSEVVETATDPLKDGDVCPTDAEGF